MSSDARSAAVLCQWAYILSSLGAFVHFVRQRLVFRRCKWEVIYVSAMGALVALLKISLEDEPVVTFTVSENGRKVPWLRYAGWLITCPVLLIHLGNLPGEANFNILRLMKMLCGLQLMIVNATAATMTASSIKWLFYFLGICSCTFVFSQAFDVFYEANSVFPEKAKKVVRTLAATFYGSWIMFAMTFLISPHGLDLISDDVATCAYAVADVLSKTIYSLVGWHLRWKVLRKANGKLSEEAAVAFGPADDMKLPAAVIADFDAPFASYLCSLLSCKNVEARQADSPAVLFNTIVKGHADVVMVNHDLIIGSNYRVVDEINTISQAAGKRLYIISYSPEDSSVHQRDGWSLHVSGVDDHFTTPVSNQVLDEVLMRWRYRTLVAPVKEGAAAAAPGGGGAKDTAADPKEGQSPARPSIAGGILSRVSMAASAMGGGGATNKMEQQAPPPREAIYGNLKETDSGGVALVSHINAHGSAYNTANLSNSISQEQIAVHNANNTPLPLPQQQFSSPPERRSNSMMPMTERPTATALGGHRMSGPIRSSPSLQSLASPSFVSMLPIEQSGGSSAENDRDVAAPTREMLLTQIASIKHSLEVGRIGHQNK